MGGLYTGRYFTRELYLQDVRNTDTDLANPALVELKMKFHRHRNRYRDRDRFLYIWFDFDSDSDFDLDKVVVK